MNLCLVRASAPRLSGWQRTAVFAAGFFLLWEVVTQIQHLLYPEHGVSPIYPVLAVDVLFLIYAGWRWWPLIPICAVFWAVAYEHEQPYVPFGTQVIVGLVFALATRYVMTVRRVSLPLRNLRDVAIFAGVLGILAPLVAGLVIITLRVVFGLSAAEDVPALLSAIVFGDAAAVMVLVPTITTFVDWKQLRLPAEHQDPSLLEIGLSIAATVVIVVIGTYLQSITKEPVLDLSFVAVSWLAIRYGTRGAALGTMAAYLATTAMHTALGMSPETLLQSQGFLFASSLMAFLLAGLTTERWELLARLSRRAYVDELTGLPNRERLVEWIGRHGDVPIIVVIMDVDDMRLLNQGVGRVAADHVLQEMAIRMRATFPSSYFVARVSADEFAVAVVDDRSPHAIMSELRAFFDAPFDADGSRVFVSVSMGAVRTGRAGSADEILRKADIALDRAKATPSRAVVYSPELTVGEAPSLVGELHRAVENGELVPFFQPMFRFEEKTQTWRVCGAEALLRWIHPERGVVTPASFIDLLERLSIGEHVGWEVMEKSLLQAVEWRRVIPDFQVWVNLFARQVLERNCARRIAELLERTGASPLSMVVEINEGVVASDERDVANLALQLREMGVMSAIDDFGTGGSSLGRVRDVPANVLKIDRSFVNKSEVDAKAKAVAATVVRLASELGMTVVAEGVENAMQLDVMRETGCQIMQGYALGHPLPADLFERTFLEMGRASSL